MMKLRLALLTIFMTLSGSSMAVEEAEYTVSVQQDKLEVRDYEPSIVAEVTVNGDFENASNTAFRSLFKYISGDNEGQSKIAMTAPVAQKAESEKIAMTAPVGQRKSDQGWAVSFMMPASYTMDTIPMPQNPAVVLREIPAYRAAAIRYSGRWSEKNYQKHLERLQQWIETEGFRVAGEPVWARYNAPFVPWFMRRNEILIPLES